MSNRVLDTTKSNCGEAVYRRREGGPTLELPLSFLQELGVYVAAGANGGKRWMRVYRNNKEVF